MPTVKIEFNGEKREYECEYNVYYSIVGKVFSEVYGTSVKAAVEILKDFDTVLESFEKDYEDEINEEAEKIVGKNAREEFEDLDSYDPEIEIGRK